MTEDRLRELLKAESALYECHSAMAQSYGISDATLSSVLLGKTGISERVARLLGYRRVVTFSPLEEPTPQAKEHSPNA